MPVHLQALIIILVLAIFVFRFAKAPICALACEVENFNRRRNLWFGVTLALFLAHNFWIFIAVAGFMLISASQREPNKLSLYFLLLFAAPPMVEEISGFGILQHLIRIDYHRLLGLTVLLPAYLYLRKQAETDRFGSLLADKYLAAYIILQFLLMLQVTTLTNVLRHGLFYAFIDTFLPYYVASRAVRNLEGFRDALTAFVLSALVLSAIAMFEFSKHWLLYGALQDALGSSDRAVAHFSRGEDLLRAVGSARQPVPLGLALAVAMGLALYLERLVTNRKIWLAGLALLIGGLVAALSRGPWVGAAVTLLVYVALGKSPGPKFAKLAILGAITVPVLIASPFGSKIIDLLPFVGTVDEHNVSYRADFTRISIGHILDNPLFGDPYFNDAAVMEELKPQGLLDTLNIFIAVGLGSGLTGMSLFSGVFIVAGAGVFKCMRRQADRTGELYHLGQVLFSTFVGLVVILCTISGISFIPMIYWTVVGLCISYARMLEPTKVAENVVGGSASPKTMIRSLPAPGINMVDSSPRRQGINGPLVARHKK